MFPPLQEAAFLLRCRKGDELRSRAAALPSGTQYSVVFLVATTTMFNYLFLNGKGTSTLSLWLFVVCGQFAVVFTGVLSVFVHFAPLCFFLLNHTFIILYVSYVLSSFARTNFGCFL